MNARRSTVIDAKSISKSNEGVTQLAKGKFSYIDAMDSAQLDAFIASGEITQHEHDYATKLVKKRAEA